MAVGRMDWHECIKKSIAKEIKPDRNLITSARKIAAIKIESANALPKQYHIGKITLLYDALREYLECIALEHGYKIYNHECYTTFIKELLGKQKDAEVFDSLRKIRNGINYYGNEVSEIDAEQIIASLTLLIEKFRKEIK